MQGQLEAHRRRRERGEADRRPGAAATRSSPYCASGGDITLSLRPDGRLQFTAVGPDTGDPTGPLDKKSG
ncbi:hypothetical protein ACU686_26000 [Yinghuangia aomiensis]